MASIACSPFLEEIPLSIQKSVPNVSIKSLPSDVSESPYTIIEQPIGTRRPLRIVCMGAGYSGLMMGIVFSQKMQNSKADLVIYERNEDLGGTWLENRYPGCQCDIPAHNYAFSFEPNPEWPNYYATAPQIHQYLKKTSSKYGVDRFIKYRHQIKSARWNEGMAKWDLEVTTDQVTFKDQCDVFINAGGVLNNWNYPNIEGIHDFKGKLLHSAQWDQEYDFTGKSVAVIGIGSSGIQIVPKLAKVASRLTSFVRSKTWISPAPGINEPTAIDPDMDADYNYTPETLRKFSENPEYLQEHRQAVMDRRIENFKRAMANSDVQRDAQKLFRQVMTERLGVTEKGKKLAEMLIPDFPVGCRRQTPGPGFLEAVTRENVDVRWDDIAKITRKGILTRSGEELEFDAICCATGFDTTFQPRFPIIGRNGTDLAQRWTEEAPSAYFGIAVPDMPNYFSFIGPNSPISNGSLILGIQMTGIYIYNMIEKLQTQGVRSLDITHAANDEYNEHIQEYLQRTVWVGNCRSWYKRGTIDGRVVAIYGGTTFHFMEALRSPRWEDYKMDYVKDIAGRKTLNRFSYLGNGFTIRETKNGSVGETQTLTFDDYWKLLILPELHN